MEKRVHLALRPTDTPTSVWTKFQTTSCQSTLRKTNPNKTRKAGDVATAAVPLAKGTQPQCTPTPHGPRNLRQDLDEADDNAFDSPLINLAEAAILMLALPDTPQNRKIQGLTVALRQIGRQNPAPSASHNSRTPTKQKGHQEANQGNHPRGQPRPKF